MFTNGHFFLYIYIFLVSLIKYHSSFILSK